MVESRTKLAMYYVYILVSFVTGELYIGYTNNIKKRIVEHNTNRSFSTRKKGPWILVYNESYSNFEKTPGYQPGDELNLICRPPLEGNRGLLVRGGRHKSKEDAMTREYRLKNYGQALNELKKRISGSLSLAKLVRERR